MSKEDLEVDNETEVCSSCGKSVDKITGVCIDCGDGDTGEDDDEEENK